MAEKVYIFGDSVLKGVVLDDQRSRYKVATQWLIDKLAGRFDLSMDNRSSFGCTIAKAKKVIERTLARQKDCEVAVLEYGGNDCNFDWPAVSENPDVDHRPVTEPEVFMETYEGVVRGLQAQGIKVVIMNLPPVDSEYYLDFLVEKQGLSRESLLRFLGDVGRISRFQELYSRISEQVALRTGAILVDIRSRFLEVRNYRDHMCKDGLHPSSLGHGLIYDSVLDYLQASH